MTTSPAIRAQGKTGCLKLSTACLSTSLAWLCNHQNDLKWSTILKFPTGTPSRFDGEEHTSVEVTLSDKSIFQKQNGFRRAGLQFLKDSADGPETTGVKTLHFSVKQDPQRPLNLTHEYLVSPNFPVFDALY